MIDINKSFARVDSFSDSKYLAECLYDLSHDDSADLEVAHQYNLMEARDNILGLWELVQDLSHLLKVEIKKNSEVAA